MLKSNYRGKRLKTCDTDIAVYLPPALLPQPLGLHGVFHQGRSLGQADLCEGGKVQGRVGHGPAVLLTVTAAVAGTVGILILTLINDQACRFLSILLKVELGVHWSGTVSVDVCVTWLWNRFGRLGTVLKVTTHNGFLIGKHVGLQERLEYRCWWMWQVISKEMSRNHPFLL